MASRKNIHALANFNETSGIPNLIDEDSERCAPALASSSALQFSFALLKRLSLERYILSIRSIDSNNVRSLSMSKRVLIFGSQGKVRRNEIVIATLTFSWLGGGISTPLSSVGIGTSPLKAVLVASSPVTSIEKYFHHNLSTLCESVKFPFSSRSGLTLLVGRLTF